MKTGKLEGSSARAPVIPFTLHNSFDQNEGRVEGEERMVEGKKERKVEKIENTLHST